MHVDQNAGSNVSFTWFSFKTKWIHEMKAKKFNILSFNTKSDKIRDQKQEAPQALNLWCVKAITEKRDFFNILQLQSNNLKTSRIAEVRHNIVSLWVSTFSHASDLCYPHISLLCRWHSREQEHRKNDDVTQVLFMINDVPNLI